MRLGEFQSRCGYDVEKSSLYYCRDLNSGRPVLSQSTSLSSTTVITGYHFLLLITLFSLCFITVVSSHVSCEKYWLNST
jgi:hypothetical protein